MRMRRLDAVELTVVRCASADDRRSMQNGPSAQMPIFFLGGDGLT